MNSTHAYKWIIGACSHIHTYSHTYTCTHMHSHSLSELQEPWVPIPYYDTAATRFQHAVGPSPAVKETIWWCCEKVQLVANTHVSSCFPVICVLRKTACNIFTFYDHVLSAGTSACMGIPSLERWVDATFWRKLCKSCRPMNYLWYVCSKAHHKLHVPDGGERAEHPNGVAR